MAPMLDRGPGGAGTAVLSPIDSFSSGDPSYQNQLGRISVEEEERLNAPPLFSCWLVQDSPIAGRFPPPQLKSSR